MKHRFVEFIPDKLENEVIYVALEFGAVLHNCACGCGHQVSTPLAPRGGWQLTFDGETVSLHPSIGSWSLPCRSHYWLRNNEVIWARDWAEEHPDETASNERTERASTSPEPLRARAGEPGFLGWVARYFLRRSQ